MTCDTSTKMLAAICVALLGCGDKDPTSSETGETETSGDGDPGDGDPGDGDPGDGDPGDGDPGDGDPGDGDPGDGDPGDGDGDGDRCAAMDAATGPDPCVTPIGWAWKGTACVEILCSCEGTDCGGLFETLDECQAAYLECLEGTACADLGAQACAGNELCAVSMASPMLDHNGGPCLAEAEFVGCDDAENCDDALTWGCNVEGQPHLFPSSCMPDGFTPCAGQNDLPDCR